MEIEQLKRIADALEEVLRLVKEDKAETKKYLERNNYGYNTIKKNSGRPGRDPAAGEGRSGKN